MQTRSRERKRERSCGWARMSEQENLDRRVLTIQKPSLIVKPKVTLQFCGLSVKWKHKAYTANWRNTNCDKQTDPHYICSSPLWKVSSCCVIISYEAVCPVCSYQVLFISICKHKESNRPNSCLMFAESPRRTRWFRIHHRWHFLRFIKLLFTQQLSKLSDFIR